MRLPDTQVCAGHSTPFRAFADAYFGRSPVSVWKASRGFGGKSFLMSLLGHCEANTLGADVTILGGSGEQSQRVLEYLQRWASGEANTRRRTNYESGGRVTALMASSRSVRGAHPQRLRVDECDEVDLQILDASLGQPMSGKGLASQTVLSSTHHYPDGTMTEILRRASENSWPVHLWCWRETSAEPDGWLSQTEIATKRGMIPAAMWAAEYDLQEPSPESRAILPEAVSAMFRKELGEFAGNVGEYIEIEPPQPKASYSTGADWAKEKDYTVIVTFRTDIRPRKLVAFERINRTGWPAMIRRFDERVIRFPGTAYHDMTGVGGVVDDFRTVSAKGLTLVGQRRADLFTDYIAAIEDGAIIAPLIRWMEGEHRFVSQADLTGAGHPPDSFVAGALAWKGAASSFGFGVA